MCYIYPIDLSKWIVFVFVFVFVDDWKVGDLDPIEFGKSDNLVGAG